MSAMCSLTLRWASTSQDPAVLQGRRRCRRVQAYADTAGKPPGEVELEDVMMAIQSRGAVQFMRPPPLEVRASKPHSTCISASLNITGLLQVLQGLAERRNRVALPQVKTEYGLPLPRLEDCLLTPNFQVRCRVCLHGTTAYP